MHFHLLLTHLLAQTTTTKPGSSTKSSSSLTPILILMVVFAVGYFVFIRPRSQRMRQQQAAARQVGVGDEVVTIGGIYGKVVALDADSVELEVSPGVVITVAPRAIDPRQQPGPASGRYSSTKVDPPDDPWETDPDGPGDRATFDEPPASTSHWDEPAGDDPSGRRDSGD